MIVVLPDGSLDLVDDAFDGRVHGLNGRGLVHNRQGLTGQFNLEITFTAPDDPEPMRSACRDIATFDWVVFTSANAVERFIHQLLSGPGDVRDLHGVKLCAVGPATAEALARHLRATGCTVGVCVAPSTPIEEVDLVLLTR